MKFTQLKYRINRIALRATAFSACLGLLLVVLFVLFRHKVLLIVGYFHLLPTVLIHVIILSTVLVNTLKHPKELTEHFLTVFLMLLNIPLAIGCARLVFNLL